MIRLFPAHPSSLGEIRRLVRNEAVEASVEEGQVEELTLAVSEACANAIRHTDTREIRLGLKREGHCVVIEIEDQGVFRDRLPVPEVEPGGRGILLMTAFVDEVAIKEGTPHRPGTVVRLVKCRRS